MTAVLVHDLLLVDGDPLRALTPETPWPEWARAALRATPWVVVRRARPGRRGEHPVGIRGVTRGQRLAAYLATAAVAGRVTPAELTGRAAGVPAGRRSEVPAFGVVGEAVGRVGGWGTAGPGGSVAFELATGWRTSRAGSDLDLVVRCERLPSRARAVELRDSLAGLPVRVDALLETGDGGVSLDEYADVQERVLLRTVRGPRLVAR